MEEIEEASLDEAIVEYGEDRVRQESVGWRMSDFVRRSEAIELKFNESVEDDAGKRSI